MAEEAPRESGRDRLMKSLDARSAFFQLGYYLRALESPLAPGPNDVRDGPGRAREAGRLLARIRDTAWRCSALESFCPEIDDVSRLLAEKAGGGLPPDLDRFLGRCARRWFGRVRELSRKNNSLAGDIAFKVELAGLEDISADLYESLLCLESGAFRASRLMSRRALEKALIRAGAAGDDLEGQLGWAKKAGLVTSSDMRSALANHGRETEDEDASSAEWALDITLRLTKKSLRAELEEGLRRASVEFGSPATPVP